MSLCSFFPRTGAVCSMQACYAIERSVEEHLLSHIEGIDGKRAENWESRIACVNQLHFSKMEETGKSKHTTETRRHMATDGKGRERRRGAGRMIGGRRDPENGKRGIAPHNKTFITYRFVSCCHAEQRVAILLAVLFGLTAILLMSGVRGRTAGPPQEQEGKRPPWSKVAIQMH